MSTSRERIRRVSLISAFHNVYYYNSAFREHLLRNYAINCYFSDRGRNPDDLIRCMRSKRALEPYHRVYSHLCARSFVAAYTVTLPDPGKQWSVDLPPRLRPILESTLNRTVASNTSVEL